MKKTLFVVLFSVVGLGVVMRRLTDADWGFSLRRSRSPVFGFVWFDLRPKGQFFRKGNEKMNLDDMLTPEQRLKGGAALTRLSIACEEWPGANEETRKEIVRRTALSFMADMADAGQRVAFALSTLTREELGMYAEFLNIDTLRAIEDPLMLCMGYIEGVVRIQDEDKRNQLLYMLAVPLSSDAAHESVIDHSITTLADPSNPLARSPQSSEQSETDLAASQGDGVVSEEAAIPPAPMGEPTATEPTDQTA